MNMKLNSGINQNVMPSFVSALKTPKSKEEKTAEEQLLLEQQKADEKEQARLKKQQEQQKQLERQNQIDMLKQQLEASNEEAENMEKGFSELGKCLTIATRIMRGDIVPQKDMKFLMEHEPDLYKQSILMRQPNKDPKKWKSILEDEDEESGASEAVPTEDVSFEQMAAESLTGGEGGDMSGTEG